MGFINNIVNSIKTAVNAAQPNNENKWSSIGNVLSDVGSQVSSPVVESVPEVVEPVAQKPVNVIPAIQNKVSDVIQSTVPETVQKQETQQTPIYQTVTPADVFKRMDEENKKEVPKLTEALGNFKDWLTTPEYENVGDRGRSGEVDVKNIKLSPNFTERNTGAYDPSKSFYGFLDSAGDFTEDHINNVDLSNVNSRPTVDTNANYEDWFDKQGYTGEAQHERTVPHLLNAMRAAGELGQYDVPNARQNRDLVRDAANRALEETSQTLTASRKGAVDDGTMDMVNLTSNYMTGEQYLNYLENGVSGSSRTIEDIKSRPLDTIYNKRYEMMENGFTPYIPNNGVYGRMILENAADQPTSWYSKLRGLRNDNVGDYDVYYNGQRYSGAERDKDMTDWINSVNDKLKDLNDYNNDVTDKLPELMDPNADHTNQTPYMQVVNLQLEDGTTLQIPAKGITSNIDKLANDGNGNFYTADGNYFTDFAGNIQPLVVNFADGTVLEFDTVDDYNELASQLGNNTFVEAPEGTDVNLVSYWDPYYVSKNGTKVHSNDAIALVLDDADQGVRSNYGFANWKKPSNKTGDWIENGHFNMADFAPKTVDMALSSVPYFFPEIGFPLAASTAHQASITADPMAYDYRTGTTTPLSSNIDNGLYASAMASNLAMPLTELGFGNIGSNMLRAPLKAGTGYLAGKFGNRAWMPIANEGLGVVGEGVEEIYGNAVEEGTRQGPKTWYGNQLTANDVDQETIENNNWYVDANGNIYDAATMYPVKDPNTVWYDRLANFLKDAPEAFIGGSILGGFGTIPTIRPSIDEAKKYYRINQEDMRNGYNSPARYRDFDNIESMPLSPDVAAYYGRKEQ